MTTSSSQHRFLIIADGQFGPLTSKTANSCLRYFPERIVGVFDRAQAGKTVQDVLGFGGAIPVVGDFAAGLRLDGGKRGGGGWRPRF
jgi:D-glutamate N-acetyltransferase